MQPRAATVNTPAQTRYHTFENTKVSGCGIIIPRPSRAQCSRLVLFFHFSWRTEVDHKEHKGHQEVSASADAAAKTVVDAALKVHRTPGPGLLESAYETCLVHELGLRGLAVRRQVPLPIQYEGLRLDGGYRIDLLVANALIVEVKAVEALSPPRGATDHLPKAVGLATRPSHQLQRRTLQGRREAARTLSTLGVLGVLGVLCGLLGPTSQTQLSPLLRRGRRRPGSSSPGPWA